MLALELSKKLVDYLNPNFENYLRRGKIKMKNNI